MPPGISKRLFSQTIPDPVPESIPGTSIVVIHPGSQNLRIGRASDPFPVTVPHCIARRHLKPGAQTPWTDQWMIRAENQQKLSKQLERQGLQVVEEMLQNRPMTEGTYRPVTSSQQLYEVNRQSLAETTEVPSTVKWTCTDNKPGFLIGEQALYVDPRDCYDLHWPIRRGRLNLHEGPGGTLTAVLQDLETLWGATIQNYLDIPQKDFSYYRAVLLIPDLYERQHVREIMNLLLIRLGFGGAFVAQESVCGAFGAGVTSGCVVDVGDQKTSVCCVDDGSSIPKTRLCMEFGGSDISKCFHSLLCLSGFPYRECNLARKLDAMFMQELKETYCHLDQDQHGIEEQHIQVKHPGANIVKYTVQMGDERILAPLSLLRPELLGLEGMSLVRVYSKPHGDPSDPHDDEYLELTQSKQEQAARLVAARKKEAAAEVQSSQTSEFSLAALDDSLSHHPDEDDMADQAESVVSVETPPMSSRGSRAKLEEEEEIWEPARGLLGIDQAILGSIDKCENADMKRRMYSNIVVLGGGLNFAGAGSWLHYLLWTQMPAQFRITLESIDVITRPKELDPQLTCWKGGAILSILDTAAELWIRPKEWQKWGTRTLRERAPFSW